MAGGEGAVVEEGGGASGQLDDCGTSWAGVWYDDDLGGEVVEGVGGGHGCMAGGSGPHLCVGVGEAIQEDWFGWLEWVKSQEGRKPARIKEADVMEDSAGGISRVEKVEGLGAPLAHHAA